MVFVSNKTGVTYGGVARRCTFLLEGKLDEEKTEKPNYCEIER